MQQLLQITDARAQRKFVPADFTVQNWEGLEHLFESLYRQEIADIGALEQWLLQRSELDAIVSEEEARRYIRMTCNTRDTE
ncbi:MAG: hypothetical protein EAZ89_03910, partial [Bacteroidetes bacterium]